MQEWYSGLLIQHGADVLDSILPVVREANSNSKAQVQPLKTNQLAA